MSPVSRIPVLFAEHLILLKLFKTIWTNGIGNEDKRINRNKLLFVIIIYISTVYLKNKRERAI